MRTQEDAELLGNMLTRLNSQYSYRTLMEPIKVKLSSLRTREVLVWASAEWAVDDQGKIYHQLEVDGEMVWSPVNQKFLDDDDVYQHLLTGIEAINNFYPPPSTR